MIDDNLFIGDRLETAKASALAVVLILLIGSAVFSAGYLCGVSA